MASALTLNLSLLVSGTESLLEEQPEDYVKPPLEEVRSHNAGIEQHPLGVRPSGNALTSNTDLRSGMGLFGGIPDGLVLLLLEWLDEGALMNLGRTCRGLFAYSTFDQLWRDLSIGSPRPDMSWRGSWRASHLKLASAKLPDVDCRDLFSDALHRPFLCSQVSLSPYVINIPLTNHIPKLANLSPEDFAQNWANEAFILTDPVKEWPVLQQWDQEKLATQFSNTVFRAEAVDWPLKTYVDYMNDNYDESPLYLFDRDFVSKMNIEVGPNGAYWLPECFGKDLFEVLGDQRPDHRWLIVGPARSGSTFHKDPNATSAWNAVIRGSKYWIMFPASTIPPGVYMSEDQSEVTSPLSIAEWLLAFHDEARNTSGCLEGVCCEGEVLHVPSGWWHLVVNLEPAIAITQNFVPRSHVKAAVNFLKNKPDQVSGFKDEVQDPHALFTERLGAQDPELVQDIDKSTSRKRKWEDVVHERVIKEGKKASGFNFNFGDDIEDEN